MSKYSNELKEEVVRKHLRDGRTQKSLESEYGLGTGTVKNWIKNYRKESNTNKSIMKENQDYTEILKLTRENEKLKKENDFLKKAAAFFAKEI